MMHLRLWLVLFLLVALSSLHLHAQTESGDGPKSLSNPTLYSEAPPSADKARAEAARAFLQGQCKLASAMREFSESSNKSISQARDDFLKARDLFKQVAELVPDDRAALTFPSDSPEVDRAIRALESQGYGKALTYVDAFGILAEESARVAGQLPDVRFGGDQRFNVNSLELLRDISARAADVFVAVSTLTALGTS